MPALTRIAVEFELNGSPARIEVEPHVALIDLLRGPLGLTGTKRSCEVQVCGACTVLVDGLPVSSCTLPAFEVRGTRVLTVEGLAHDSLGASLTEAFAESAAFQCGFCTPGMLLAAKALLDSVPEPTEAQVVDYLGGNVCRCTGYKKIVEAVVDAGRRP